MSPPPRQTRVPKIEKILMDSADLRRQSNQLITSYKKFLQEFKYLDERSHNLKKYSEFLTRYIKSMEKKQRDLKRRIKKLKSSS